MPFEISGAASSTTTNTASSSLARGPIELPSGRSAIPRTGPNGIIVGLTVLLAAVMIVAVGLAWRLHANARHPTATSPTEPDEATSRAPQMAIARDFGPPPSDWPRAIAQATPAAGPDPATMPRPISKTSAKERADGEIKGLEESGPASSALTASALKSFENLKKVPGVAGTEWSDFRCFGRGCAVTATSKDQGAAQNLAMAIFQSEPFLKWPGAKFRSGPIETPSGQIRTVVIFFRSPESTP
jgi:hypothetical protein